MTVMRANYDKLHRCPGWSGGGWDGIDVPVCAGKTSAAGIYERRLWAVRPYTHEECGTLILPSALRWFEPQTYRWQWTSLIPRRVRSLAWRLQR